MKNQLAKNLIGEKFGRLLLLSLDDQPNRNRYYFCQCDCGTIKSIRRDHLQNGKTISCGCKQKEIKVDLVGKRFNSLDVISLHDERVRKKIYWNCKCECGNECIVNSYDLQSGSVKTCGCKINSKQDLKCKERLIGKRFGRILVIRETKEKLGRAKLYECLCDCGKTVLKTSQIIVSFVSCGCLKNEILVHRITKHGESRTKEYKLYHTRKRQIAKFQQTPKWADEDKIMEIYKNCPEGMQVDHIIPLQGELVSGLHLAENLQYLSPYDNRSKNNHFNPIIEKE